MHAGTISKLLQKYGVHSWAYKMHQMKGYAVVELKEPISDLCFDILEPNGYKIHVNGTRWLLITKGTK
jgi:hypothetical protein